MDLSISDRFAQSLVNNFDSVSEYLKRTAGDIDGLAREPIPLVCKEIVAWVLWSNLAWIGVGVLLFVGAVCMFRIVLKNKSLRDIDEGFFFGLALPAVAGSAMFIASIPTVLTHLEPAIKAAVAPRLIVADYVKDIFDVRAPRR